MGMKLLAFTVGLLSIGAYAQKFGDALKTKLSACTLADPVYKPATWEGVVPDRGLTIAEAEAVIAKVKADNQKLMDAQYKEVEIIDFAELAKRYDDKLVKQFA